MGGRQGQTTLHARIQQARRQQLRPEDAVRLSNGRFAHLSQARKALGRISRRYLSRDELVLMDLLTLGKSDREVAEILGISVKGAYKRRLRLYETITAYGWWVQHDEDVRVTVRDSLGQMHVRVLVPVVHRRNQAQVARELGVSRWCVYRKMDDCVELLRASDDFMTFFNSLRLQYR